LGLFEVALALESGVGTDVDLVKAYTFANIASARSHPEAPQLRDQIEAKLTPAEVTEGQKAAREWIAAAQARLAAEAGN
jgi:hypothetical protein